MSTEEARVLATALALLGSGCLVGFAYLLFPPAALAVAGVLLLVAAWEANR